MDRERLLRLIPETYAAALRLRDAGADLVTIARALGVPEESAASLIEIAEAKLERLGRSEHLDH